MSHKGSFAEKMIKDSMRYHGVKARLIRLADTSDAQAVGGAGIAAQPSDYIMFFGPYGGFIEIKQSEDVVGFPLKNVSKSQWAAVARSIAGQHNYHFIIYSKLADMFYCVPGPFMLACKNAPGSKIPWSMLGIYKLRWGAGVPGVRWVNLFSFLGSYVSRTKEITNAST